MNEKRFIQLINLYIDGEISPAEFEELETEVAASPRRRRIYQSYCRLQQASRVVYHQFGQELAETVDLKKYQILARHSNRCLQRGLLLSAAALAAACVTVVAAVALFQDARWGASGGSSNSVAGFGAVEVFEPGALNARTASARFARRSNAEPLSFGGRSASVQRQRETGFHAGSTMTRDSFRPAVAPAVWEETDSVEVEIQGRSSFDAPELISFQFQR